MRFLLVIRHLALVTVFMRRSFGLTGGIASGKSTVARFLEALGAKVVDADRVGHELLHSSSSVQRQVVERFGTGTLNAAGEIDRPRLASIVFSDPKRLRDLTSIIHPVLIARVEELAAELCAAHPRGVVLVDAALIYEAGLADHFARILVAWCTPEQQVERLMAKTGLSPQDALRRIASQIPGEEKRRRGDYVIDCSGSLEQTRAQAEALYPELERLAAARSQI